MSRHLQYLNCLRTKLKVRYGLDDEAVGQVELVIQALEDIESRYQEAFPPLHRSGLREDAAREARLTRPL